MLRRKCVLLFLTVSLFFPTIPGWAEDPETQEQNQQQQQQASDEQTKTPPPQKPEEIIRPAETASTPSTARKILSNFWSDQKGMWSSPFHMNRSNAKWWGVFGLTTAALVATDRTVENRLKDSSVSQISFSKNVSKIGATYTTLPIAGALYVFGRKANNAKAREVGVLGAEALLDSAIVVSILKLGFGRERPDEANGNGRFFHGKDSFPSGHAIQTWAFASVISHEYAPSKIVPIVTYGLAAVVSTSRITGRRHYPADIVAGGAMGWFIGKYVWDHHLDPNIHKRFENKVSRLMPSHIAPTFEPSTHSFGVAMAWN
jgi:membrane-associated phospholipid phosphatase